METGRAKGSHRNSEAITCHRRRKIDRHALSTSRRTGSTYSFWWTLGYRSHPHLGPSRALKTANSSRQSVGRTRKAKVHFRLSTFRICANSCPIPGRRSLRNSTTISTCTCRSSCLERPYIFGCKRRDPGKFGYMYDCLHVCISPPS